MTVHPDPTIEIPRETHEELVAHAREGAPREVCGILAGDLDERTSRVTAAHRTENVAALSRTRYEIDPEQQYAVLERIDDRGEDVVGFYHSHPSGPPGPSETDAAQATWPDRSYVIVILGGDDGAGGTGEGGDDENGGSPEPTVGSWRWTGDEFRREDVVIVD